MRKRRLKAPPPLLPESPSEGKCGPQRVPQNMPQVGILALQASASTTIKGATPGLPKQGPPWDIEGEPEETKAFKPKRPFEAENEGDTMGHTGHRKPPGHIKTLSAPPASQITKYHSPQACTRHCDIALKLQAFILRPIKRVCGRRRTRWQHSHLPQPTHHTLSHTRHA
jgi:hypothetical protein